MIRVFIKLDIFQHIKFFVCIKTMESIMIGKEGGGLLLGFARLLLWSFWSGGQVRTRGNGGIALGKLFHILHNKDSVIVCRYSYRFTSNIL